MTECQWLVICALAWFPASLWVAMICGRILGRQHQERPRTNDDLHP